MGFVLAAIPMPVHTLFEILAISVGIHYYRTRSKNLMSPEARFSILTAAFVGAALGCKISVFLEQPVLLQSVFSHPSLLIALITGGKSILGAILGAWLAIELCKKCIGLTQPTGDTFAQALILAIIIGRLGCFLCGLSDHTYGIETTLPWGVDFGDGIFRHPLQLYEIIFLTALSGLLIYWTKSNHSKAAKTGDQFQWFMIGYCLFRFSVEWLKPVERFYWGLDPIQLLSIIGLLATIPFMTRLIQDKLSLRRIA